MPQQPIRFAGMIRLGNRPSIRTSADAWNDRTLDELLLNLLRHGDETNDLSNRLRRLEVFSRRIPWSENDTASITADVTALQAELQSAYDQLISAATA